jgi:hypothetical protein
MIFWAGFEFALHAYQTKGTAKMTSVILGIIDNSYLRPSNATVKAQACDQSARKQIIHFF